MSAIDAAIDPAEHRLYEAEDRMLRHRRMLKGATDFDACLSSLYDRRLEAVRSQIEGFDRIKATFDSISRSNLVYIRPVVHSAAKEKREA